MSIFNQATMRAYSDAGFALFPCKPGTKHPALKGYADLATSDFAMLCKWLKANPNYNFACRPDKSRLVVLDADFPHGLHSLTFVEEIFGKLPNDVLAQGTPSGGLHIVFRAPSGVTIRSSQVLLGPGLEIKALNMQFMVSPSEVNGIQYTWLTHNPVEDIRNPTPAPLWMIEFIVNAFELSASKSARDVLTPLANFMRRQSTYRNNVLYWCARRARDKGVSLEEAIKHLAPAAEFTGLESREVMATIKSAYK